MRRDGVARGVSLDRYDVERYNVMGLRVLPMAGSSYRVTLTKGRYHRPVPEDYQIWAEKLGVDRCILEEADERASAGDFQPLREVLARLTVLMD